MDEGQYRDFFQSPTGGSVPFFRLFFRWSNEEYAAAKATTISYLQKNRLDYSDLGKRLPAKSEVDYKMRKQAEHDM